MTNNCQWDSWPDSTRDWCCLLWPEKSGVRTRVNGFGNTEIRSVSHTLHSFKGVEPPFSRLSARASNHHSGSSSHHIFLFPKKKYYDDVEKILYKNRGLTESLMRNERCNNWRMTLDDVNERWTISGTIEMYETLVALSFVEIISFYFQSSRLIDREVE